MITTAEVMSERPVCLKPDDVISKARSIIRKHGFRALPVIEDGKIVGIISRRDVLKVTSSRTNVLVGGLMTSEVFSVGPDDDIFEAARQMVKAGVRQLPVVDRRLVGIVSSFDILNAFVQADYHPLRRSVRDVYRKKFHFCNFDDRLSSIWDMMVEENVSSMPVLEDNRVIGMISMSDIMRHGHARISEESGKPKHIAVEKVMSTPALTVNEDYATKDVASLMARHRFLSIPVLGSKGKLVGVVDVANILKAYTG
ncbi:MAG: CBS domain-containing protein [Candidatus Altiarchaeota archaeon]